MISAASSSSRTAAIARPMRDLRSCQKPASNTATMTPSKGRVVCAAMPDQLVAVGRHYDDFSEVPDDAVRRALAG